MLVRADAELRACISHAPGAIGERKSADAGDDALDALRDEAITALDAPRIDVRILDVFFAGKPLPY